MSADTPARLLQLLSLLQTPREWPGGELADRLCVSRRTVRRDIDRLRELGYPVQATQGACGGYRLVAGKAMPPLVLDDEEAVAIAVGLRAGAGHAVDGVEEASVRALAKLEQVLPSRLRHRVSALGAATMTLAVGDGARIAPETLTVMASATAAHERLRFAYEAKDGTPSRRLVEPHRLVSTGRRWYLVAYDLEREDWRTFRVDRVSEPFATGVRFAPRMLPGGSAEAYVRRSVLARKQEASAYEVDVEFHAPVDRVGGRLPASLGELVALGADRCRLRGTATEPVEWVAARLIWVESDFTVHGPRELVTRVRELGDRLTRAATGGTPLPPDGDRSGPSGV